MKILMISRFYNPHVGGVEKHVEEIAKELINRGNKVTVLTLNYTGKLKTEEIINDVQIIRLNYFNIKFIGLLVIWFQILKRYSLFKQFYIVHVHDVFLWLIALKFMFPSMKIYLTNHGWEGVYPIPIKNIILKKISARLSSGTISVGQYIDKYYGIKSDIFIYGAVDKTIDKLDKKEKIALYLGRLERDTGLLKVIPVIKKLSLNGYKIIFLGDGSLRKYCTQYGQTKGFVNPSRYLEKSEICFAGGYLSIIESLANKNIVVVGYDNRLKKDCFRYSPFYKWIIASDNSNFIWKNLKKILDNKNRRSVIIKQSSSWARIQTWDKITDKYLNLWQA